MKYDPKVAPYVCRERMRRRAHHEIGLGILLAVALIILHGLT